MNWERQHEIDRQRIAALEQELDQAQERIRQLEQMHFNADWSPPFEIGLTASEARVVSILTGCEGVASKDRIMQGLYSLSPNDPPLEKIVDVLICKARAKLKPFGVEIVTRWGRGYEMPPASRAIMTSWGQAA
jgi:DNA-binding response OmpR family regulator